MCAFVIISGNPWLIRCLNYASTRDRKVQKLDSSFRLDYFENRKDLCTVTAAEVRARVRSFPIAALIYLYDSGLILIL